MCCLQLNPKKIKDLERTYQEMIACQGVEEVYFKIPKLVHQAITNRISEKKLSYSLSAYYFQLSGFAFYKAYEKYFDLVQSKSHPERGSILLDDLPEVISKDTYHRIMSKGYYRSPLKSRRCPAIFLSVADYLHKSLNYSESKSILLRELTLPIVIDKLFEEIKPYIWV